MALTAPADGIGPFTTGVADANFAAGSPANIISNDFTATLVVTGTDPDREPVRQDHAVRQSLRRHTHRAGSERFHPYSDCGEGPTLKYDYGHNFLFQSHENGGNLAYISRINMDVTDPAHRVTLLTPVGGDALTHFSSLDGLVFDPFTSRSSARRKAIRRAAVSLTSAPRAGRRRLRRITAALAAASRRHPYRQQGPHLYGRGQQRFLGQQRSERHQRSQGRPPALLLCLPLRAVQCRRSECRRPASSIAGPGSMAHRSRSAVPVPSRCSTMSGRPSRSNCTAVPRSRPNGSRFTTLQAARTISIVTWPPATAAPRRSSALRMETSSPTAKFRNFFFVTTGDTNNLSGSVPGLAARGAWGGIFQLNMGKDQNDGTVKLEVLGDADHNSFDNITFGDSGTILTTEDRGDSLHDQLNTLDSIWAYPLASLASPYRVVALGRDASGLGQWCRGQ